LGLDRLRYNRTIFRMYDRLGKNDAPAVVAALRQTFPTAHRLLDVGAGTGAYAAEATRQGCDVVALERSTIARRIAERAGTRMLPFDLATTPKPVRADLAYSFEVAEHIPANLAERFVHFLTQSAPVVVITAAAPGQGGTGHVNEQPIGYWVALFSGKGWTQDQQRQAAFVRDLPFDDLSEHWRLTNILVFAQRTHA
jgi:SAM-dependent methyltransferase